MSDSVAVPRHLRNPGEDGYRTPTIEDAERALSDRPVSVYEGRNLDLYPSTSARIRQVHTSALESLRDANLRTAQGDEKDQLDGPCQDARSSLHSVPILSWKQRIRHITWAFFTLTMATGGIANVLYDGKSDIRAPQKKEFQNQIDPSLSQFPLDSEAWKSSA